MLARIDLRVTKEEKAAIVEAAKARGMTISEYILERVRISTKREEGAN